MLSRRDLTKSVLAGLLIAGFATSAHAADFTLSVNSALTEEDPLFDGLRAFKQGVEERSGGKLEIKLFPSSQLGKDEDVLEQARAGAPVAVVVDGGRLAVFEKEFGILGAPYLASGFDGIRKVVTSDLFEGWVKKLHDSTQLQVLSFNWWQGERHVLTKKSVSKPEDLQGIRMRTPGAPVWTETVTAMGATPTPMGWTEVYSGLQQGVIDGAEAQYPAIKGSKLHEVITHITETRHINLITGMVTSGQWFDSLPDDLKTILREEALKGGDVGSRATEAALAGIAEELGKTVTIEKIDTAPFEQATAGVYDKLGYGELRDTVKKLAAE